MIMPGGDRTGPAGMGPMTGRGAGVCAGYAVAGAMNPVGGRCFGGMGRGRGGGGRGWRHQFYATGVPGWARGGFGFGAVASTTTPVVSEVDALKQQAEFLQNSLTQVNQRIQDIESK